jgi:hypothetical protein
MLAAVVVLLRSLRLICSGHRAVALENLALRQQLSVFRRTVRRPQIRTRERLFWVILARAWRDWRKALIIVQPDTVVRWHRQWLRRRWAHRSAPTRPGRPSTPGAIRTLVEQMAAANPLWGAPRIHGELGKLGLEVSERTVSRLLRRRRRPPSRTWRTFLTNHVCALVSMDFFTVPTLTGRMLFVLVLPYAERLIGSIRRECLDHVIVFNRTRLRRILTRYVFYYHGSRTHLSLAKDPPTPRRVQAPEEGRVIAFPEVGGLHHRYERRAA